MYRCQKNFFLFLLIYKDVEEGKKIDKLMFQCVYFILSFRRQGWSFLHPCVSRSQNPRVLAHIMTYMMNEWMNDFIEIEVNSHSFDV